MFNQYLLIIVWLGFMALFQKYSYRKEYCGIGEEYEWRVKPLFAFLVMAPVIWMAANRGWFADTTAYIFSYRNMPESFANIPRYLETVRKDKGFAFLSAVLRCLLGRDHFPYLFILALYQGVSVCLFFRKYTANYVFAIFLFVASTDYISWMFNGLRQFMAVTTILFATPFMIGRPQKPVLNKYLPIVLIILLASTFHQSALIMIPLVFIAQGKAGNRKTLLLIFLCVAVMAFVERFTGLLDDMLSTTQYVNVVSDYTSSQDDGTNPLRVLVYSIPGIFALIYRKPIRDSGNALINFCANMSVISMGLYLVSMVTSGIYLGRLPIYCSLYGYILLPWEMHALFKGRNRTVVYILCVFLYIVFYYYQNHFIFGLI